MTLSPRPSPADPRSKRPTKTGAWPADPTTASDVYNPAPGQKPVLADGERIKYFSTDTVGNAEAVRTSATAQVDLSAPTTTDDVPATVVGAPVEVTLSATDSGGAAVDKTYYTTGASPADPTTASDVYNPAPGQKPVLADGERIKYFSTDTVGNAEAVRTSATVSVRNDPPPDPEPVSPDPEPVPPEPEPDPDPAPPPNPVPEIDCQGRQPTITAAPGVATKGTRGDDVILGTSGADVISGGGGDDVICGLDGDDRLIGGAGSDQVRGNSGDDRFSGRSGGDTLFGGPGADTIRGGRGADRLFGGDDDDNLNGGRASDGCSGGPGRNRLSRCESPARS